MVDVFDRHEVRFDPRLAGCSRFVRYSDFANLAAENERLKQRIADYQRDTSTVDAHETVNVSDKPEGQPEPVVDTEPWGYWVKHKYAEGGLVRTPCFIPEESHYTEVLPLYTSPPTSELEAENARLRAERDEATAYMRNILTSFVGEHFPDNDGWKPLGDLVGMLTQIDNASTIASEYKARLAEAMEAIDRLLAPFEGEECWRDHHGYCQTHFLEEDCSVNAARRVREGGK